MTLNDLLDRVKREEFYKKREFIEKKLKQLDHKKTVNSKYMIDTTDCLYLLVDRICKDDYFFYILLDEYGVENFMPDYEFKKCIKEERLMFIEE
jgi:hypothetical protein